MSVRLRHPLRNKLFSGTHLRHPIESPFLPGPTEDINFGNGTAIPNDWTFSRSTTAMVRDHEGIYWLAASSEIRYQGHRRVETSPTSGDGYDVWTKSISGTGVTPVVEEDYSTAEINGVTLPTNRLTVELASGPTSSANWSFISRSYSGANLLAADGAIVSMYARTIDGGETWIGCDISSNPSQVKVTGDWTRVGTYRAIGAGVAKTPRLGIRGNAANDTLIADVEITELMNEPVVSAQTVKQPSEFISAGTIGNSLLSGIEYRTTLNGNAFSDKAGTNRGVAVDDGGVITEAAGTLIAAATREGVLLEPAATNLLKDSRDGTTANWTLTGTGGSRTQNAVGIDGRSNAATTITDASAASAPGITQVVSGLTTGQPCAFVFYVGKDADTSRFPEAYFDFGGSLVGFMLNTSTGATAHRAGVPASDHFAVTQVGGFWRVVMIVNSAPSTGGSLRLFPAGGTVLGTFSATAQGSAVFGQSEAYALSTTVGSPIFTSASAVTRNADSLTKPFGIAAPWTIYLDCEPQTTVDVASHAIMGYSDTNEAKIIRGTTRYTGSLNDGVDNPSADVLDSANGYSMGDQLKIALSTIDGDEALLAVNGFSGSGTSAGTVDTSGFATIGIGMLQTGGPDIPITIKQYKQWNISLSSDELESETS